MVQHHPQQSRHLGHKSYIIYIYTPCSDTPAWSKSSLSMGVPSESPALRRRKGRLFKRATRWARAKLGPIKQHSRWCVHKQIYWLLTANPECDQAHAQQNKIAVTIWKGRVASHLLKEKKLIGFGWLIEAPVDLAHVQTAKEWITCCACRLKTAIIFPKHVFCFCGYGLQLPVTVVRARHWLK